jgi:hypothetical protein
MTPKLTPKMTPNSTPKKDSRLHSIFYNMPFCKENGFVLTGGCVFRPIDSYSNISDKPLTSSAVNGRLKSYLVKLNLWEGETPHSTRGAGCALTLAWMGIYQESIKQHVDWKSNTMFHHYTVGNDMCSRYASAKALFVEQSKTPRQKIYEHCKDYLN